MLNTTFDGDMCSWNALYTEDSKNEFNEMLGSRAFYVNVDGAITYSAENDVNGLVLSHLTGEPEEA